MKPANTSEKTTLDDLIFENRNKSYGAYFIRTTYENAIKKAFTVAVIATGCFLFLFSQTAFKKAPGSIPVLDPNDSLIIVEMPEPPIDKPAQPAPPPIKTKASEILPMEPVSEIKPVPVTPPSPEKKPEPPAVGGDIKGNPNGDPNADLTKTPGTGEVKTFNVGGGIKQAEIITYADEMPEFIGGDNALKKFILSHFRIPNNIEEDHLKIRLCFVVNEEGKVTNVQISKGVNEVLNDEAVRVVSSMPDWKPGKMNGKPVKVRYYLPISIRLQ